MRVSVRIVCNLTKKLADVFAHSTLIAYSSFGTVIVDNGRTAEIGSTGFGLLEEKYECQTTDRATKDMPFRDRIHTCHRRFYEGSS